MVSTYPLLNQALNNFIGNIEARYILEGKADVVICDGFTGNIVLKLTEGLINHLLEWFDIIFHEQLKLLFREKLIYEEDFS